MAAHLVEDQGRHDPSGTASSRAKLEDALRLAVSDRVGEPRFALWFGKSVRLGLNNEGDSLIVRVPDSFFRDWIERHHSHNLMDAAEAVVGRRLRVLVEVIEESGARPGEVVESESRPLGQHDVHHLGANVTNQYPSNPKLPLFLTDSPSRLTAAPQSISYLVETDRSSKVAKIAEATRLFLPESPSRQLHQLDEFVTGASNRMAFAAAVEITHTAGVAFNPLMIHRGIGIGKTHLLEGINHSLQGVSPAIAGHTTKR